MILVWFTRLLIPIITFLSFLFTCKCLFTYTFWWLVIMSPSKCIFNNLTVGCWNIEGIYENINSVKISKLTQPSFLETLKKHDILCLQETHVGKDEIIPSIDGYYTVPHCRTISGNNRYFGGILIFVKSCIKNGIKFDGNVHKRGKTAFSRKCLSVGHKTVKSDFFHFFWEV